MAKLSDDGKIIDTFFGDADIAFCFSYYIHQVEKNCYNAVDLLKRNYLDDTALILTFIDETLEKGNNANLSKAYKDIYYNAYVPQYNALAPKFGVKPLATIKDNEITR